MTRPGASLPLRPASWVRSWNVRSSARKSGSERPVSASTTAASLDAGEVVSLRDHLRADEDGRSKSAAANRSSAARSGTRLRDGIGVEADPLQLRNVLLELAFEFLRTGADARELRRAARRARLAGGLASAAMVAAERAIAVERERNVAVRAAASGAARAAVKRRRDAAAVEEEDRLCRFLLRERRPSSDRKRRGERVRLLAAQVDDAHRGHRRADPAAVRLEPLERLPRLGPRRRRAERSRRRPRAQPRFAATVRAS